MNKRKAYVSLLSVITLTTGIIFVGLLQAKEEITLVSLNESGIIKLPSPRHDSDVSVEEALLKRRSVRAYRDISLTLAEVSQILWAAQGITDASGLRTAPSAGAIYPLELYVVAGNVNNLPVGIYKYRPHNHELLKVENEDRRAALCSAAINQLPIRNAAVVIVLSADYERTTMKYGERGKRYVHMEAVHAAQNVCLQAVPLNLGTVVIGAFNDSEVRKVIKMKEKEQPLYVIPVGGR